MKRILILLTIVLSIGIMGATVNARGQALSITTLKAGYFNPKGSKAGFVFGAGYSWVVDEAVDIGFAVDYFRKNYTDETEIAKTVSQGKIEERELVTNAEFTTNILPIYGIVNIKFPAGYSLDYFLSGALGYEMLFSKEQIYGDNPKETSRFYSGMKWMLSAGIMFRVGSRSSFIVEGFYDGTTVSRDKKNEQGLPARYEVDLSGFGIRAGIRMGFQ